MAWIDGTDGIDGIDGMVGITETGTEEIGGTGIGGGESTDWTAIGAGMEGMTGID